MKFDIDYIEQLAKIFSDNDLTEVVLEEGEQAITLRKEKEVVTTTVAPMAAPVAMAPAVSTTSVAPTSEAPAEIKNGTPITAPMVGTFYGSPSPDAEPFAKVGQSIKAGDVVCIIEAMKLMNELEAEVGGKILEICVENGEPVEFGQVLMYVG